MIFFMPPCLGGAATPLKIPPYLLDNLATQNLTLFSKKVGENFMDLKIAEEVAKQATEYIRKLLDKIKELEAENERLRVELCEKAKS